jgi:hypothetical protein
MPYSSFGSRLRSSANLTYLCLTCLYKCLNIYDKDVEQISRKER